MGRIRVLVVDEQALLSRGLAGLIGSHPALEAVGEVGDGMQAVAEAARLQPDVVIMDAHLPSLDGISATRLITRANPQVKVVLLMAATDEAQLFEALKAGAHGCVLKDVPPEALFEAVVAVGEGRAALSPPLAEAVVQEFVRRVHRSELPLVRPSGFTERETQVLGLLSQGCSNRDIADALSISLSTVKSHVHNILEKLHVPSRTQAAAFAFGNHRDQGK